jgi:hypothetical protein
MKSNQNVFKTLMILCLIIVPLLLPAQTKPPVLLFGLSLFKNREQVEFCVPVPQKEYRLEKQEERAKFLFRSKKNKKFSIALQGLHRSDDTTNIQTYFQNSTPDEERDAGKVVLKKELIRKNNCFYFYGYWSNFIYESRFLEIVWLRKEDVVTMTIDYPVAQDAVWQKRLRTIITSNSICK